MVKEFLDRTTEFFWLLLGSFCQIFSRLGISIPWPVAPRKYSAKPLGCNVSQGERPLLWPRLLSLLRLWLWLRWLWFLRLWLCTCGSLAVAGASVAATAEAAVVPCDCRFPCFLAGFPVGFPVGFSAGFLVGFPVGFLAGFLEG